MNEATVQTILNYVITFLSTGVGATVITIVVKAIVSAVANVKSKKYSKLTDGDRDAIVNEVKTGVLEAIKDGVTVDMDAQLDKATARRITAVEKSQNDIVSAMESMSEYQRVVLSAIGDFKTISQHSKEQIQAILKDTSPMLEKVECVEQPRIEVNRAEQIAIAESKAITY